jgi:hypothetical protein
MTRTSTALTSTSACTRSARACLSRTDVVLHLVEQNLLPRRGCLARVCGQAGLPKISRQSHFVAVTPGWYPPHTANQTSQ